MGEGRGAGFDIFFMRPKDVAPDLTVVYAAEGQGAGFDSCLSAGFDSCLCGQKPRRQIPDLTVV